MPKSRSYGVLIVDAQGRILLAHATGRRYWDIPKGGAEPGESAAQSAAREALEETGIALEDHALHDLGVHAYLPAKDLHLFMARVDSDAVDIANCRCSSMFTDHRGRQVPEVDRFRWAGVEELPALCTARMAGLLRGLLGGLEIDPALRQAQGERGSGRSTTSG